MHYSVSLLVELTRLVDTDSCPTVLRLLLASSSVSADPWLLAVSTEREAFKRQGGSGPEQQTGLSSHAMVTVCTSLPPFLPPFLPFSLSHSLLLSLRPWSYCLTCGRLHLAERFVCNHDLWLCACACACECVCVRACVRVCE